jgi:hypothetical protein
MLQMADKIQKDITTLFGKKKWKKEFMSINIKLEAI